MIDGFRINDITKHIDERGFFSELMRSDWKQLIYPDPLTQINLSYSYPDIVRAWHRHLRGQVDYFVCIDGAIKVCAYDDREDSETFGELDEVVLNSERLQALRVPGFLWHGYKAIGTKPIKMIYGVNRLYEYKNPDEERRPWNDKNIIPKSINGKTNDPRIGKPWDWYYTPNK